jgi:hypothetical protein
MLMRVLTALFAVAPDVCLLGGLGLIGTGLYRWQPEALWFYGGAMLLLAGWLGVRMEGRR